MALETLTLDEAIDLVRAAYRGEQPTVDLSEGSDRDRFCRMLAFVFTGNQQQGLYLLRQSFPHLAEGEYQVLHAALRGIDRLPAAKAVGRTLLVGSADGLTQAVGSTLKHADGTEFETLAAATLATPGWAGKTAGAGSSRARLVVLPSTAGMAVDHAFTHNGETRAIKAIIGTFAIDLYEPLDADPVTSGGITAARGAVARVEASEAGKAGNKPVGETLTLDSPTAGITAATTIQILGGGGDEETPDELGQRIAAHEAGAPNGANLESWRQAARETPDVRLDDAFIYPGFRGPGTVDVVVLGVRGARRIGVDALTLVAEHLADTVDPLADFSVLDAEPSASAINVDVTLKPRAGYEPDWGTGSFTTDAGSTTTRVELLLDPSGTIEVGDRILAPVVVGTRTLLEQREVSVVGSDHVIVSTAFSAAPAAGVAIRSGGPLVEPAMEAIDDLFESLGPGASIGVTNYARHPDPGEAWDDRLRVNHLIGALLAVEGMRDASVTTPASDQNPQVQTRLEIGTLAIRHDT